MTRHIDKILLGAAILLALTICIAQTFSLVRWRVDIVKKQEAVRALVEQSNKNNLPTPPQEVRQASGRAFRAWEELPVTQRGFTAKDFFPQLSGVR